MSGHNQIWMMYCLCCLFNSTIYCILQSCQIIYGEETNKRYRYMAEILECSLAGSCAKAEKSLQGKYSLSKKKNPALREMHFVIITWQGPYKHPWFWNLLNLHFLASISSSHRCVWTKVTNSYLIKLKNWLSLTWSVVKRVSRIAAISAAKLTQVHQCTAMYFKSLARETDTQESLGITKLFSVAF